MEQSTQGQAGAEHHKLPSAEDIQKLYEVLGRLEKLVEETPEYLKSK